MVRVTRASALAGLQAEQIRAAAGLSWAEIVTPSPVPYAPPAPLPRPYPKTVGDAIALVTDHAYLLSAWERKFVTALAGQTKRPTTKQRAVLRCLVVRARIDDTGS